MVIYAAEAYGEQIDLVNDDAESAEILVLASVQFMQIIIVQSVRRNTQEGQ
jgi:hypothetical protein